MSVGSSEGVIGLLYPSQLSWAWCLCTALKIAHHLCMFLATQC